MKYKTIHAPHVNANDLELVLVEWMVEPWQFVEAGDKICLLETTKAAVVHEAEWSGFIVPVVEVGRLCKVGEPLAHVFEENDKTQLDQLNDQAEDDSGVVVSKKAQRLMDEAGLTVADFRTHTMISSETVVATLRKRVGESRIGVDEAAFRSIVEDMTITRRSVVIYGEPNQALLAVDAFESGNKFVPVAVITEAGDATFAGYPVIAPRTLEFLRKKDLLNVFLCGANQETVEQQRIGCEALGLQLVSAIHAGATVSRFAKIGRGVFIGPNVSVGPDVTVGDFCRVLSGASIAHHCVLEKYATLSDGCHVGGNVEVGSKVMIGIGASVNKRIRLGEGVIVVSGATVVDDVPDAHTVRLDGDIVPQTKLFPGEPS